MAKLTTMRHLALGAALLGGCGLLLGLDSRGASVLVLMAMILSLLALVVWMLPEADPWRDRRDR
jgi:hypothetical protein